MSLPEPVAGIYLIQNVDSKNLAQVHAGEGRDRYPCLTLTNGGDDNQDIFWEIKQLPSGRYTIKNSKHAMYAHFRADAEVGAPVNDCEEKNGTSFWSIRPIGEEFVIEAQLPTSDNFVIWGSAGHTEDTPIYLYSNRGDRKNHWRLILTSVERQADGMQDYESRTVKNNQEELSRVTNVPEEELDKLPIELLVELLQNASIGDEVSDDSDGNTSENMMKKRFAPLKEMNEQEPSPAIIYLASFETWSISLQPHLERVDPSGHQRNCSVCDRCIGPETCYQCLEIGCAFSDILICEDCQLLLDLFQKHNPDHAILKIPRRITEYEKATIVCDSCKTFITGTRYHCLECSDYDLCSECEKHKDTLHNPHHPMVSINADKCCVCGENKDCKVDHKPGAHGYQRMVPDGLGEAKDEDETPNTVDCDFCDQKIWDVKFTCMACPDFSLCSSCAGSLPKTHPDHKFVKLRCPERPSKTKDDVWCNVCGESIDGTIFHCIHPYCTSFDMCIKCATSTTPKHPLSHILVRVTSIDDLSRFSRIMASATRLLYEDTLKLISRILMEDDSD